MSTLVTLPPEARHRLETTLQRGEVVRWAATADPARSASPRVPAFLGSLRWLAGSGAFGLAAGAMFYLTRTPEALVAAIMGGCFAVNALIDQLANLAERRRAARRVHAVTNRRVLVLDPAATPPLVEIDPERLAFVSGLEGRDGWGDVDIQYRPTGAGRDDPEQFMTFQGVPEIDVASNAIERLAFEHGNDIGEPLDDDEDEAPR
jgi:hypothetical protein